MCQDKKTDKPHKCCGNCRKDFDKSAPKQDKAPPKQEPPKKRTCGTKPPEKK